MGLTRNIIDRRKNAYLWESVDVILEATWHDNAVPNSDQAPEDCPEPDYMPRRAISVVEAVAWASLFKGSLTLYLYDKGSDAVPEFNVPGDRFQPGLQLLRNVAAPLSGAEESFADRLVMPGPDCIDFDPPRLGAITKPVEF